MTISRDEFLSQVQRRYVEKVILGKPYRFRNMTEGEKADYEIKLQDKKAGMSWKKARALLICRMLVDSNGDLVLTDGDVNAVMNMDGAITSACYAVALDHNGYEENDIEDLVKNSNEAVG